MKLSLLKKFVLTCVLFSAAQLTLFAGLVYAQTDASVKIQSGAIYLETPDTFAFDSVFLPEDNRQNFFIYKILSPENASARLVINDNDTAGLNYKVSMNISNLISESGDLIPFTDISAVTIASDAQKNIDAELDRYITEGMLMPSVCPWKNSATNPETDCDSYLNDKTFVGQGELISDPLEFIQTGSEIITVQQSSAYKIGDLIIFEDVIPANTVTNLGSIPHENLNLTANISDVINRDIFRQKEIAIVKEIVSPTQIKIIRGASGTTPLAHQVYSKIKNIGNISLEHDLLIAPETQVRSGRYSFGFIFRMLLESGLGLKPGNYSGTITFSLYTCGDTNCL